MKKFTLFAAMFVAMFASSSAMAQTTYQLFDTSVLDGSVVSDGTALDMQLSAPVSASSSILFSFGTSGASFALVALEEKEIDKIYSVDGEEKAEAQTTLNTKTGVWRIDNYFLRDPTNDSGKGYGTKVLELAFNETEGLVKVKKVTGFLSDTNKKVFVDGGGKDDDLDGLGKTPIGKSMKTLGFKPKKIKKENGKWEFEFEPCDDDDSSGSSPLLF